jgi:FixJ family two-component response regulator
MEPLIAIIDDDAAVRDALQRLLRSHGFFTEIFASAEQFLSGTRSARASCVIADVRMPGMTGMALHDYLVSQGQLVPTILITARPTSSEQNRANANGVISYLAKPLDEQILLDTVREALANDARADAATAPAQGLPTI